MGQSDTQTRVDTQTAVFTQTTVDTRAAALLGTVLLIVGSVWVASFIVRVHAHQASVDDYFYALVSRNLATAADPLSAFLHTGQTAPLVPFLGIPGVKAFGLYGAMSAQLPILLILCAGAFVLSRQWLSPFGAAVTSLAAGLNTAVLGWSLMLNFSVASTAAVLWCFAAYAKSNRFSSLKWSIAFGFAFAMLLLARSIAPVYAVPLGVMFAVDVVVGIRRDGQRPPGWHALAAVATTLVIAGPWWLVSGSQAIDYLTSSGYQASSGATSGGVHLTLASVIARTKSELGSLGWLESVALGVLLLAALWIVVRHSRARRLSGLVVVAAWVLAAHELGNLGWLESVVLGVPVLAALWFVVRHSRAPHLPGLWILTAWVVVTLLVLSSSGNGGTGFGVPLIAVTIVLCAAVIGSTIEFGLPVLAVSLAALLVVGCASQFTSSTNLWWHDPPYRSEMQGQGGSSRTNTDQLTAQVAASLGRGEAIQALDSGILNFNGLEWNLNPSTQVGVPPYGPGSTGWIVSRLPHVHSLVTGTSLVPFDSFVDESTIERAAWRSGLHPAREWSLTNDVSVVLWNRGPTMASVVAPSIVKPRNGSELSEADQDLVAVPPGVLGASVFGVSKVTFQIAGETLSHPVETAATQFALGWFAPLNVSTLAKGKYTITCDAKYPAGERASSRAITAYVK